MSAIPNFEDQFKTEKQKEVLDDNARKFVVEPLDPAFLEENGASSFLLTTDWLETNEDNEKKLAHKRFENGDVQILLIAKVIKDGRRTSEKEKLSDEEYARLLEKSVRRLEKIRYEFEYTQNDTVFNIKYDEFIGSELRVLEVDASSEYERGAFEFGKFPGKPSEVTGKIQYYGYRVADIV